MRVHSTSRCHEFGHPEISFEADESIPPTAPESFVSTLESMVASGSVFRPGETMQYGLVLLKFQSDEQGRLVVTEPDFSTRPIQYRRGLTSSLIQMLRQLYTLDSYGIDRGRIDFPTLDQRAIICRNFQAAKKFHLSRNKGCPPEDSGWFFGCFGMQCNHNNPSYLQSLSLFDAVSLRSESANWLALPGEVHVILAPGEKPIVELEGADLKLIPGSFVDQFSESRSRSPSGLLARLNSWLHQRHSRN